ncbi:MAG: hypothetical protein P1U88_14575 [Thalassobaculaceae bacterium]|nr:hypothetical protein [Thalassobaculaceae bacterium]
MASADTKDKLDPNTHFVFQHRVFQLPDARFELSGRDRSPVMRVELGDIDAVIPIDDVSSEFGISPDSPDGKLLVTASNSLKFVRDIRPGDSIPSELLDGTASWRVEDHHRELAKNRLMVQVATWLTGDESVILDMSELRRMSTDSDMQRKVRDGISKIAESLGLGVDRRDEVLDMIDRFARELCYIEALRDRYNAARSILGKLGRVGKLYKDDKHFYEEVNRANILMRPAMQGFTSLFDQVDAQTSEIMAVLKTYDAMVKYVREIRDELHQRLIIWDQAIKMWDVNVDKRNDKVRDAVRETYRFVAFHFPQTHDWI